MYIKNTFAKKNNIYRRLHMGVMAQFWSGLIIWYNFCLRRIVNILKQIYLH